MNSNEQIRILPVVTEETISAIVELYPDDMNGIQEKIDSFYDSQPLLAAMLQRSVGKVIDCNEKPKEFVTIFSIFMQAYFSIENQVFEEQMTQLLNEE